MNLILQKLVTVLDECDFLWKDKTKKIPLIIRLSLNLFRPRSRSSRSSRADDSSVASSRTGRKQERPPSRDLAQSGRRSNNQSRDYTDDSYTLTESEMSFDIPETRPRRSSRDVRSGRRSVDLPIKEEEEGEDFWRITPHHTDVSLCCDSEDLHSQRFQLFVFLSFSLLMLLNSVSEDFEESGKFIIIWL